MTMIRRFFAEATTASSSSPWNISYLLELRLGRLGTEVPVARRSGRSIPLREVNMTYYAADVGKVFMTSGNNPFLLAWNVAVDAIRSAVAACRMERH